MALRGLLWLEHWGVSWEGGGCWELIKKGQFRHNCTWPDHGHHGASAICSSAFYFDPGARRKAPGCDKQSIGPGVRQPWAQIPVLLFIIVAMSKSPHLFVTVTEVGLLNTPAQPTSPLLSFTMELAESSVSQFPLKQVAQIWPTS